MLCKDSYDCLNDIITEVVISDLATKLRKQCYDNGVEIEPRESAKTLHQLGLAYKEKSPDNISLIQSVALMTSAVLRQPENADDIRKDLDDVCMHIMTLANAANPDAELVSKAVAETKAQIQVLRENTNDKLSELKPMSDDLKGEELNAIRRQRVKQVKDIQDYVTETYKQIMGLIGRHTVDIMGKAPCKFALVGMGSLANKEVTPYSDFESIIVLEEGIQNYSKYPKSLEYFRWFATVFQVILVRLGETILKFLAIPCLNNPLNKEKDWYYDAHTPCGICPDGFAPQASKNPLGRQTKTQKKPWTTELIKPVSEMVKYLETEEDLKNGYHLADMLTTTCFVYGDYFVFNEFELEIQHKLNQIPSFNQRVQQNIEKDYKLYNVKMFSLHKIDIKRVALRRCSLFILPLGHLYNCKNLTCFDILDELRDRAILDETIHGKLQFSLAVACEMRLRWYSTTSGQNDILYPQTYFGEPSNMEDFTKTVGCRAVVDGINVSLSLQKYVVEYLKRDRRKKINFVESPLEAPKLACILQMHKLASKLLIECKNLHMCKNEEQRRELQLLYAGCLSNMGKFKEGLKVSEDELARLDSPGLTDICAYHMKQCCLCLIELNKYEEALEYARNLFEVHSKGMQSVSIVDINTCMGKCYYGLHDDEKAQYYFKLAYNDRKDRLSKPADIRQYTGLLADYTTCLLRLSCYHNALSVNERLISERRKLHVREETDQLLSRALYDRGFILFGLKRYEEALVYLDKSWKCKFFNEKGRSIVLFAHQKYACLKKLGRLSKAQSFLKHVWQEKIELLRKKNDTGLCVKEYSEFCSLIYHEIFKFYYKDGQLHYAVKFAKKSFHLSFYSGCQKSVKLSVRVALGLAAILFKVKRYKEGLAAAKHGIKLCQFVYENCCVEENFVTIANIFARCERQLKVETTLPYHHTPSIFYHAENFFNEDLEITFV